MAKILEVKNLVKKFGSIKAVNDISFSMEQGEIVGYLGPNGAGKTTTTFCILGLLAKDEGKIKIFGKDLEKNRSELLKQMNYSSAEYILPWNLTVYENLKVYATIYEVSDYKKRIDEILEVFKMGDLRNKIIRSLSTGQRARVNICKALLNRPKLLLLDEPMSSMDPDVVDRGIELLKKIQKSEKMSILYTSHNMWEMEEIANRIIFINHGKIVAQGSPVELTKKVLKGSKEANLREVFIHISRETP